MKVLVSGGREWVNRGRIREMLVRMAAEYGAVEVVHGACRGADRIAGEEAQALGMRVIPVPAEWEKYKRPGGRNPAGIIRNRQMLQEHPDIGIVLAFHDDLETSKGTKDMTERSISAGIPTYEITATSERKLHAPRQP